MFELVHLCAVLWVVHLDGGHAAPTLVPAGVTDASAAVSLGTERAPLAARRPGVLLRPGPAESGYGGGGVAPHVHRRSSGRPKYLQECQTNNPTLREWKDRATFGRFLSENHHYLMKKSIQ